MKKEANKSLKKLNVLGKTSKAIAKEKTMLVKSTKIKKDAVKIIKEINSKKTENPITPENQSTTVFVGNLPINVNRIQVLKLFEEYAPVNNIRFRTANGKPIYKHKQRREAGCVNAYVVLDDAETAQKSLNLNNTLYKGKHLRVTKAALSKNDHDSKRTILVGNLKYSADEEKLRDIFSSCGDIEYIRCLRSDKGCKGVAYVCFKSPDAIGLALELKNTMLDERPINVERYTLNKLGAKIARDQKEELENSGAKQRIKSKTNNNSHIAISSAKDEGSDIKRGKFRGVKVEKNKQKDKPKPTKTTSEYQKLAKKIAPRTKNIQ